MIKNYIKIAWRHIVKSPFYSLVNIVGLASGIGFTLMIGAFVWSELEVNKQLRHASHQYILQSHWKNPDMGVELTSVGPLAKTLKENYPDLVANYYRWDGITTIVAKGDKIFREGIQICDSTMLKMYGFKLLQGDANTALNDPYTVVITAEKAKKYFGKPDVIGQTLNIQNFSGSRHDFIITGVMDKPFKNSVTYVNDNNDNQVFISTANLNFFGRNMGWFNQSILSYIELQPGVKPSDLAQPMKYLLKQNAAPEVAANLTPYLVSLKEYNLSADNGLVKKMLYALSGIALFILLMAVINFINMSVSRSAIRMKEIGIRKVLGGFKRQLIGQFLTESIILVAFATSFALAGYELTKDLFSSILGKPLPALSDFPASFIIFPILLTLLLGLISGIYPAFVLSSLQSIEALKGKLTSVKENILLRKSLVGFQFGTATIVCIGAIIITQQISLFFSDHLGYRKDYKLSAQLPRNWSPEGIRKMEAIRRQFAAMPQISSVTLSYEVPDGNNSNSVPLYKAGADSTTAISSQLLMTDEYYAATYDIPMVAGEFYCAPGAFTDSSKVVINESHAHALGWKNATEAIGKEVMFLGGGPPAIIAGVTKDFHFGSMQKAIQPVTFAHVGVTNTYRFLTFKLKPGNTAQTLAALQKQWSASMPGVPFEYKFMDDTLAKLYKSEIQLKKAANTATVLALMIVLLGVLGLVSLSIQKRTREIGIRKVLGASVRGIMSLFIKEFLVVNLIAAVFACPLAYLIMQKWLTNYVYRIELTPQPFITTVVVLGFITALFIGLQSLKVALANPVKSLRSE